MSEGKGAPCWAVLGEMAELGPDARTFHRSLGEQVEAMGLGGLIVVGSAGEWVREGIHEMPVFIANDVQEAVELAEKVLPETARVLVKASRSVGLERLVMLMQEKDLS